jgi:steroid delta-isomerase-like uncharacterized protein
MPRFDARAYVAAWNARNLDDLMDFYAEDAELVQSGIPEPITGKGNVRQAMAAFLSTFKDTRADLQEHVATGDRVVLLLAMTGTHAGDVQVTPEKSIPAAGKTVRWETASFLTVDADGKITRDRGVVDAESMLHDLGVLPGVHASGDAAEHQH